MVSQLADRFDTVSAESPHSDTMLIVYADDVRLMATTPQKVADMVSAAGSWLTTVDMTFSTTAGKNVAFATMPPAADPMQEGDAAELAKHVTGPDGTPADWTDVEEDDDRRGDDAPGGLMVTIHGNGQ